MILEAGFPGSSLDWTRVQPAFAKFTRVCSYDRAGFGWSDLHEPPRSAVQIAEELHLLLSNAAVPGPYVLVGHSMGGLYSRAFVRKFPESVVGLVLVDATHEDQWDFEPTVYWRFEQPIVQIPHPPVERPPDVAAILREMWATDKWNAGERRERDSIGATIADAQNNRRRLPPIPLVVLSAGAEIRWNDGATAGALKSQQLQRELAALSPFGKWVPVPGICINRNRPR
ncbi:MAG: alpha/beta fold hydrolase [Bryobacteraceae bacterium]